MQTKPVLSKAMVLSMFVTSLTMTACQNDVSVGSLNGASVVSSGIIAPTNPTQDSNINTNSQGLGVENWEGLLNYDNSVMCTMQYEPVCASIKVNGQIYKKTFGNACGVSAISNEVVSVVDGSCE